ncbi:hypothetical protein M9Y10_019465 [Tritrichomonas musculus]|uniref:Myb-like DNA-binding domain containing protein n=1 Tax=Tritrichomonas musculus TaxID=1915356 RepID=A0ABR2HGF0_9EUKA
MITNTSTGENKKKISRYKFLPEEDEELSNLVSIFGQNWITISQELAKTCPRKDRNNEIIIRTPRQCKDRYLNYLSPDIINAQWTPEEDHLLELQVVMNLQKWKKIKPYFPGRTEYALRNRFNYIHKGHFNQIKPIINEHLNRNPIYKQYTPTEIVQQAFDLKKKVNTESNEPSQKIQSNINLSAFEKLYKKYNKGSASEIAIQPGEAARLLRSAVKTDALKDKIEFIKQEASSLSTIVENRALFQMLPQLQNYMSEVSSDYDPFNLNP